MANGLKFSDQELADLRQVAYGGYRKTAPKKKLTRGGYRGEMTGGGAIDYNFYSGRQRKKQYRGFQSDMPHFYEDAGKGSTSANFAKIAKELGIKNVDSTRDLQQMYDYVLGYKPPQQQQQAAAPVEEPKTGFDSGDVLPGQADDTLGKDRPQADSGYQPPSVEDTFSTQIAELQKAFTQSMQQQMQNFQQMQMQQSDRMAALQQQMQQSMQQSMMQAQLAQQRPQVANVQMAESAAGTPMQIARRGVTGAFGRRGMRIKGLNV